MVFVLKDFVVFCASEHVDEVVHTKALARAVSGRQGHLGGLGAIPAIHRSEAVIAVAAGRGQLFTKIGEECLAAAAGDFAQAQHGVEAVLLFPFVEFGAL